MSYRLIYWRIAYPLVSKMAVIRRIGMTRARRRVLISAVRRGEEPSKLMADEGKEVLPVSW